MSRGRANTSQSSLPGFLLADAILQGGKVFTSKSVCPRRSKYIPISRWEEYPGNSASRSDDRLEVINAREADPGLLGDFRRHQSPARSMSAQPSKSSTRRYPSVLARLFHLGGPGCLVLGLGRALFACNPAAQELTIHNNP